MNWRNVKLGDRVEGLPIKGWSRQQWLSVRNSLEGVGGSEIGYILGNSEYKSPIRLFYEKVGLWPAKEVFNEYVFWGRKHEPTIRDTWQHFGSFEGGANEMMRNEAVGIKPRKCRVRNFMFRNPKYPYLFANLDGEILKTTWRSDRGVLEIKTISGFAADKWPEKIPPYHLQQVQGYLLVTGYKYAELVYLQDGRISSVWPVLANPETQYNIVEACNDFILRVQEAKKAIKGIKAQHKAIQEAAAFAPEVDATKDLSDFYDEVYREKLDRGEVDVTQEVFELAVTYDKIRSKSKEVASDLQLIKNKIKEKMIPHRKMVWDNGYITYGKTLTVKFKE